MAPTEGFHMLNLSYCEMSEYDNKIKTNKKILEYLLFSVKYWRFSSLVLEDKFKLNHLRHLKCSVRGSRANKFKQSLV